MMWPLVIMSGVLVAVLMVVMWFDARRIDRKHRRELELLERKARESDDKLTRFDEWKRSRGVPK